MSTEMSFDDMPNEMLLTRFADKCADVESAVERQAGEQQEQQLRDERDELAAAVLARMSPSPPTCVHCGQGIYFADMWRHQWPRTSACINGRTNAQPRDGSRWTPPAEQRIGS